MAAVERNLEMNVSAENLFNVITDFPKYPEFVDEVVSVEILEDSPTRKKVKFELEVIKRFDYVLDFSITPKSEVSWKLVSSNFFKKNEGRWRLTPAGTDKTAVNYSLDVAVSFLVPSWVTKKLTETNLPKMFASFEGRAKKLAQG